MIGKVFKPAIMDIEPQVLLTLFGINSMGMIAGLALYFGVSGSTAFSA